jgi:AcrR family transcriptional regulator
VSDRPLTRKERQAHTRARLMHSAAKVAAARGLDGASLDLVAEEAGFTKGAVYANFESKEALFLAMLDQRFEDRLAEIDRTLHGGGTIEEQARRAGGDFIAAIAAAPEWERLFFEFAAYAARNDDFRQELVTRYRSLRDRIGELYRRRVEELGVEPPVPVEDIALMTFAMANGIAFEKLLEPDAVSEELYGTMLMIFFTGLRALVEGGEEVAPQA